MLITQNPELFRPSLGIEVNAIGNSFNFKENWYPQLKQVVIQRAIQPV
jgi:hypothetical protein